MARPKAQQQQEKATYEADWSDDNQDRCPGYRYMVYEIAGEPYQTMIKCEMGHPHQEAVKVALGHRERVPLYPFIADLATERQAGWAIKGRQKRAEKRQDGRLEGVRGLREILGQAAKTPDEEQAAPVLPATPAMTPLAQDIDPDVDDWLASIKGKPADEDDDWNKDLDIPEI